MIQSVVSVVQRKHLWLQCQWSRVFFSPLTRIFLFAFLFCYYCVCTFWCKKTISVMKCCHTSYKAILIYFFILPSVWQIIMVLGLSKRHSIYPSLQITDNGQSGLFCIYYLMHLLFNQIMMLRKKNVKWLMDCWVYLFPTQINKVRVSFFAERRCVSIKAWSH